VPGPPGRVINPFLVQDPQVKARRLARALISDLISYHPAKRAQGLKDGTLKQIFEEEIKKSYEEYVAQVGPDIAKSTSHFTDALNEILAGGQKIF
jgi:L-amino acid N-acyltransferase YncA